MKLATHLRYKGVSPTLLDSFLRCPLAFFYKYLTPLEPLEEVAEEGDPPALGELVHETLQDFFRPLLGKPVEAGGLDGAKLTQMFTRRLAEAQFFRQMPAHARRMLERTAQRRLAGLVRNTPQCTPLELEKRLRAKLTVDGERYDLGGIIDRLDQRGGELVILDYKTGQPKKPAKKFWDDPDIWDVVDASDTAAGLSMLPYLSEKLGSIQMPLYLHAFAQSEGREASDAVFVCLGKDGEESPLFGAEADADEREERIGEKTPRLAGFILKMMLETETFAPEPSRTCAWCAFRQACGAERDE
nr:PD-(D/E)XK nuclease family protein [Fundidesulfovibrio terrae]